MRFDRLLYSAVFLLLSAPCGITQTVPSLINSTPLTFEPNQGQSSPEVSYLADHYSYGIAINASSVSYVLPVRQDGSGAMQAAILKLHWSGDHSAARWQTEGPQANTSNYLFGKDSSQWVTKVPHFAQVDEIGALPGVDIRYHASAGNDLEYDLVIAPFTDLTSVKISIEGADEVRHCDKGALCLKAAGLELRQPAPKAYEMKDGEKIALEASYVLKNGNEVSFAVPGRVPGSQLIIDPVIQYATYFGGSQPRGAWNWGINTAVDPLGNIFIAGTEGQDQLGEPPSHPENVEKSVRQCQCLR